MTGIGGSQIGPVLHNRTDLSRLFLRNGLPVGTCGSSDMAVVCLQAAVAKVLLAQGADSGHGCGRC